MPGEQPNKATRRTRGYRKRRANLARQLAQKAERDAQAGAPSDAAKVGVTSPDQEWMERYDAGLTTTATGQPPTKSKSRSPATPKRGATPPARRVGFNEALAARRSDGKAPMTPLGWDVAAAKAAGTVHPYESSRSHREVTGGEAQGEIQVA